MPSDDERIAYALAQRELDAALLELGRFTGQQPPAHLAEVSAHMPFRVIPPCCSFCGKSLSDVRRLIQGQAAYICDECVSAAQTILKTE